MTKEEANMTTDYLKEMQESYIEGEGYERHPLPEWYALDKAIETIEQTTWIPVSERLPEDSELVLFSTKTDRVFEGRFFADDTDRQWYSFRDETFAWNNVVTAWMPLPEPYKGD